MFRHAVVRLSSLIVLALVTGSGPAAAEPAATVTKAWARATPGGAATGAAYVVIEGIKGGTGDTLLAVATPAAGRAEIHTHIEQDGVMKMRRVEKIAIADGESHALAPGGDHIMLFDLRAPLKQGEPLPLTFTFEKSGQVTVTATIEAIGSLGPDTTAAGSGAAAAPDGMEGSGSGDGEGQH